MWYQRMNKEEQEKLKQIELNLLVCFKEICEKHKLDYFLTGGTLLGAVRHKGFIPWDDDIDVGMPREDYETFLRVASSCLPDGIFLQTRKTDPEVPFNFAKLRDSRTTFIETSIKDLDINHGVYIDIFPIDYFPASKFQLILLLILSFFVLY